MEYSNITSRLSVFFLSSIATQERKVVNSLSVQHDDRCRPEIEPVLIFTPPPPSGGVQKYCDDIGLCPFVCLSARITRIPHGRTSPILFLRIVVVQAWSSSDGAAMRYVLPVLWMTWFSCHGANGPESSTTLCLEEVRQVAVRVGRQVNYSVWSSSPECGTGGEGSYLRLTCYLSVCVMVIRVL